MIENTSCVKLLFDTRIDNEIRTGMQTYEYVNMM
jgi:hypothetical protein